MTDTGDYIRENYFQMLDRVAELVPKRRSLRVLDIAIGTGRMDMLEEFEEECFTYIDSATASLGVSDTAFSTREVLRSLG